MSNLFKGFKGESPNIKGEVRQAMFSTDTKNKQKKSVSKASEYANAFKKQWS